MSAIVTAKSSYSYWSSFLAPPVEDVCSPQDTKWVLLIAHWFCVTGAPVVWVLVRLNEVDEGFTRPKRVWLLARSDVLPITVAEIGLTFFGGINRFSKYENTILQLHYEPH